MMRKRIYLLSFSVFVLNAFFADPAQAALENNKKDINTVLVTGYSLHSRLLVDMIQFYTGQPVIYITSSNAKQVYFVAANAEGKTKPQAIASSEFHNFINFSHPRQVVFLGNKKFVSDYYRGAVNKNLKTYQLNDHDWYIIAAQCEELFGIKGLAAKYKKELTRLARGGVPLDASKGKGPVAEPRMISPKK